MRLFNTLTQSIDTLNPIDETIKIYVCGVTPYDTTHLGHAFTYVTFDTLIRYLESTGKKVKYVQNVTDIDDDVIRKANELGISWDELGKRETEKFLYDMDSLHVRRPDIYAKATDEIPRIIEFVTALIEKGYAYIREGCVFYSIKADQNFGGMAKAIGIDSYETMLITANEHGNFPNDTRKKDPLDFVLWQAQAPGEPAWNSPWGKGRPGWHIECSSMAMHYLAPQIDIHGGGFDLAFPHHTCEIAQSENYTGKVPFSKDWMHIAMVYQDGQKMSKSLGNLTLVSNLLKEHSSNVIRLVLQHHHYRTSWELTSEDLSYATEIEQLLKQVKKLVGDKETYEPSALTDKFNNAMEDDLNSPLAITLIMNSAKDTRIHGDIQKGIEVISLCSILGLVI